VADDEKGKDRPAREKWEISDRGVSDTVDLYDGVSCQVKSMHVKRPAT